MSHLNRTITLSFENAPLCMRCQGLVNLTLYPGYSIYDNLTPKEDLDFLRDTLSFHTEKEITSFLKIDPDPKRIIGLIKACEHQDFDLLLKSIEEKTLLKSKTLYNIINSQIETILTKQILETQNNLRKRQLNKL